MMDFKTFSVLLAIVLAVMILLFGAFNTKGEEVNWDTFFDAMHMVESSGSNNPPDGDGGKAIGPYQIWEVYWKDAVEFDKSLTKNGETYQSCRDIEYAKRVVIAYMNRYCNERRLGRVPTVRDMAATHNGGPNGFKKIDTNKNLQRYVEKFMKYYSNNKTEKGASDNG